MAGLNESGRSEMPDAEAEALLRDLTASSDPSVEVGAVDMSVESILVGHNILDQLSQLPDGERVKVIDGILSGIVYDFMDGKHATDEVSQLMSTLYSGYLRLEQGQPSSRWSAEEAERRANEEIED